MSNVTSEVKMVAIPETAKYAMNCYQNSIPADNYTCVEIRQQAGKDLPIYVYEGENGGREVRLHCHKLLTAKGAEKLLKDKVPAFQANFSYDKDTDTFNVIESSVSFQE